MIGSLPTMQDVRAVAISLDLIYLGCKGGTVEIWGREKNNRVEILQTGTNGKVNCMVLDGNEEVLVIGTSDGQIQVSNFFHLSL
jgi:WD40 repeat protein